MTSKLTITDERVISVIERLEHYACNLKWTNVRGAQDLLTAADGLRELQERRKAAMDSEPAAENIRIADALEGLLWPNMAIGNKAVIHAAIEALRAYHAQPAPAVQCPFPCGWDNLNKLAIQDAAFVTLALVAGEPATESIRQASISNNDRLLKVISACRAAMLQAQSDDDGEPTDDERIMAIEGMIGCLRCDDNGWVVGEMGITRCAFGQAAPGNSPAIPDGYVMVPKEPTKEILDEFDSIIDYGAEDSEDAWRRLLAAAPQEAK